MLVLVISVGLYFIECFGSSCYSISRESFEAMLALGLLESIYDIPNLIKIFRKREVKDKVEEKK